MGNYLPKDFDPRVLLFEKIQEHCENRSPIRFHEKLNEYTKSDLINYIEGDCHKTNNSALKKERASNFQEGSYSEFYCDFQYDEKNEINIYSATFDQLNRNNFQSVLNNNSVDSIGIYLFVSRTNRIICFVSFAQTYDLDETFSPSKFFSLMKIRNSNEDLQKLITNYSNTFSEFDVNALRDLLDQFNSKNSLDSILYCFVVSTNNIYGIVAEICENKDLRKIFTTEFEQIGITLLTQGKLFEIICVISNKVSVKTNIFKLSEIDNFAEDDSDDDDSSMFGENSTTKPKPSQANQLDDFSSDEEFGDLKESPQNTPVLALQPQKLSLSKLQPNPLALFMEDSSSDDINDDDDKNDDDKDKQKDQNDDDDSDDSDFSGLEPTKPGPALQFLFKGNDSPSLDNSNPITQHPKDDNTEPILIQKALNL